MPLLTKGFTLTISANDFIRKMTNGERGVNYFFIDGCRVDLLRSGEKTMFTHETLIEKDCLSGPVVPIDENSELLLGLQMVYDQARQLYPEETSEFTHWIF